MTQPELGGIRWTLSLPFDLAGRLQFSAVHIESRRSLLPLAALGDGGFTSRTNNARQFSVSWSVRRWRSRLHVWKVGATLTTTTTNAANPRPTFGQRCIRTSECVMTRGSTLACILQCSLTIREQTLMSAAQYKKTITTRISIRCPYLGLLRS